MINNSKDNKCRKQYEYSVLMKMPFDYEDFINDCHFRGMLLATLAEDMKKMALDGLSFTFETLAELELERMKVMLRLCK